jgi:hypothetical protein
VTTAGFSTVTGRLSAIGSPPDLTLSLELSRALRAEAKEVSG